MISSLALISSFINCIPTDQLVVIFENYVEIQHPVSLSWVSLKPLIISSFAVMSCLAFSNSPSFHLLFHSMFYLFQPFPFLNQYFICNFVTVFTFSYTTFVCKSAILSCLCFKFCFRSFTNLIVMNDCS